MIDPNQEWHLTIVDEPQSVGRLASLGVGDIDGDGLNEIVTGGAGALLWYRPVTGEKGQVSEGDFPVGLVLEDVDGDGVMEVIAAEKKPRRFSLFKWRVDSKSWQRSDIDPALEGVGHDLVFADVDNDGVRELVANSVYCKKPSLFIYRPGPNPCMPWSRHAVTEGIMGEGLAVADLDQDGRMEIVHGRDIYTQPAKGPFAETWDRQTYAPHFRDMCRVIALDITCNGRPDLVLTESEYVDGKMSWFENRLGVDEQNPWQEHPMDTNLYFNHSLSWWREPHSGDLHVVTAEMRYGGFGAEPNPHARVLEYVFSEQWKTVTRNVLSRGVGSHQAMVFDVDSCGIPEIVGKGWKNPGVQIWKKKTSLQPSMCLRD